MFKKVIASATILNRGSEYRRLRHLCHVHGFKRGKQRASDRQRLDRTRRRRPG